MSAGLGSIVGQERVTERLTRALAAGTAHHAYLFDGPEGVGKRTTARAFAMSANCLAPPSPGAACGTCEACRKIAEDLHPDVISFGVFDEEGKVKGQKDRIRKLIGTLAFPPHEGRTRVVIVDPADGIEEEQSNVFLKTLEEPPPRTHFILVTPRAASLRVTIRSRCQRGSFRALSDEEVARVIVQSGEIDNCTKEQVAEAASLAQGSPGRALALLADGDAPRRRELARKLLEAARAHKPSVVLEAAGELGGDRDEAAAIVEQMLIRYHDALLVAEGVDEGRLAGARLDEARWLAKGITPRGLLRGIELLNDATEALDGNMGPALAFEGLLLGLGMAHAA